MGDSSETVRGNSTANVHGLANEFFLGAKNETTIGAKSEINLAAMSEITVGISKELKVGSFSEICVGGTKEVTLASAMEVFAGFKTEITAGILFEKNSAVKKGDAEVEAATAAVEKKEPEARREGRHRHQAAAGAAHGNISTTYISSAVVWPRRFPLSAKAAKPMVVSVQLPGPSM